MILRICLFTIVFALSVPALAQNGSQNSSDKKRERVISEIKTFDAKVKVIGVLQGRKDMAVIQVMETADNKWDLKSGDEVLCKFYFGTAPFKGEVQYPGVIGGEILDAQIHAEKNRNKVQINYSILRYKVVGKEKIVSPNPSKKSNP
jgi:hypothetical protein